MIFINVQTNLAFFKKKVICSQHNMLYLKCYHWQTNIFSQSYLYFSSSCIVRILFRSRNLRPNMPKIASFLLKNRSALGALTPDSHVSPISLRILRCALYYKRHFYVI